MREKILCIMQLPPPVHGAALINKYINESNIIREEFDLHTLNLTTSITNSDVGKFGVSKILKSFSIYCKLFSYLLRERFSACYMTISPRGIGFYKDSLLAIIIKFFQLPLILHLHGKGVGKEIGKSKFWYLYYRFVFRNTYVIHLSKRLISDVKSLDIKKKIIVPNGIPTVNNSPNSKKKNEKVRLIYLSNIKKSKGAKDLLYAMRIVNSTNKNITLAYVGNWGENKDWIRKFKQDIKNWNLEDHIKILGPKYDNDKYNELHNSDIFILPTRNDCFPLSILEAMQAGLPIISTYQGAIPEIVEENRAGLLFHEGNYNELADYILKLSSNKALDKANG